MQLPQQNNISMLCRVIEEAIGYVPGSPKDFRQLRNDIFQRLHVMVSVSTLMRLWGYVEGNVQPRQQTLNVLARFVGFRDWETFCCSDISRRQSSLVLSRRINVMTDLTAGQRIRLVWAPNRICDIVYLGNLSFRVEHSVNSGLKAGAMFMCALIIEGEPLYLDDVVQEGIPPAAYICGKRNGVTFHLLAHSNEL